MVLLYGFYYRVIDFVCGNVLIIRIVGYLERIFLSVIEDFCFLKIEISLF